MWRKFFIFIFKNSTLGIESSSFPEVCYTLHIIIVFDADLILYIIIVQNENLLSFIVWNIGMSGRLYFLKND